LVAGAGMALSSLAVVANALRLRPTAVAAGLPPAARSAGGGALAAR